MAADATVAVLDEQVGLEVRPKTSPSPSAPGPTRRVNVGELILGPRERFHLQRAIDSNRLSYGPITQEFEATFARLHDSPYACFCNSGTSALQIALSALKEQRGWRDGDEVIVPAVTFVATVNVVLQTGLKPVLVDVEPQTFNIDPRLIADAITSRTRCIMPVHLLGLPADMDPILSLARRRQIAIVEDSCETKFARYKGRAVGSFGDIGCFSTYIAHLLITGVGGLLTTNDDKLEPVIRSYLNHGRDPRFLGQNAPTALNRADLIRTRFQFLRPGFSFRVTELQAAIGLGQLDQMDTLLKRRKSYAQILLDELQPLGEHLQLPMTAPGAEHSYMMFPLVLKDERISKWELMEFLE